MKIERILIWLTAGFFLAYGILFTIFPDLFADLVTGSIPTTESGLIDMRATYGGMSIAVALLMFLLAKNENTLPLGLVSIIIVLLGMAAARTLGIIIDGNPNTLMYVYLVAEIIPASLAIFLYKRLENDS